MFAENQRAPTPMAQRQIQIQTALSGEEQQRAKLGQMLPAPNKAKRRTSGKQTAPEDQAVTSPTGGAAARSVDCA